MKSQTLFLFIFFTLTGFSLLSQEYQFNTDSKRALKFYKIAENAYVAQDYDEALSALEKAVDKDPAFIEAWLLKGDIYSDNKKYEDAISSYQKALAIDPDFFPMIYFWVGNAYLATEKFAEASDNYRKFLEYPDIQEPLRQKVKNELKAARFRAEAMKNPVPFDPYNLGNGINTEADEYVNSINTEGNTIIFTRRVVEDSSGRNKRYSENIYRSSSNAAGEWQNAVEFYPELASLGNIGALTLSPDGMYLFFVVCNAMQGYGSCDLYYLLKRGDTWAEPANLGPVVNSGSWDSQPAFSSDGRTLYFASNRSGSKGSSDIFFSRLQDDGRWSKPKNLGNPVNTPEAEMAPFIHPDDQSLYFSSKGHPGMGGSDLFISRSMGEGLWKKPVNLGYPINTKADEINIIVSPDATTAYISSDQLKGKGGFDIYGFPLFDSIRPNPVTYLKGKVYDAETLEPLNARLQLIDLESGRIRTESYSDKRQGEFILVIPIGRDYALNVSREGYLFYSENFSLSDVKSMKEPYQKDIPLQPIKAGKTIVLKNIFFETDKYDLKKESKAELQKLLDFLQVNPELRLEIGGHTDTVGSEDYNEELSRKRAKAVYNYLTNHGIDSNRLEYQGYGYSEPIADNKTEKGRALNRRTELKVLD